MEQIAYDYDDDDDNDDGGGGGGGGAGGGDDYDHGYDIVCLQSAKKCNFPYISVITSVF